MLTWRLWRELNRLTPLTALYYRLHLRRTFIEPTEFSFPALSFFRAVALTLLPILFIFLGVPFLFISSTSLLPYTSLLIPLANTCYGLVHCVSVSGQLAHEREVDTYDLLCVCPPGRIGLHWAYAVNWLVRHRTFRWLLLGFISVGMFAALLGIAGNLLILASPFADQDSLNVARLVGSIANIASFWIDYVQTVILSSLTAMLIAQYTQQVSTARFSSAGAFLTLQFAAYVATNMIGSRLVLSSSLSSTTNYLTIPLLTLLIAYLIREGMILVLWRMVVRTLNASPSELDTLIRHRL